MKKFLMKVVLGLGCALIPLSATGADYTDTAYFVITRLDSASVSNDGHRVYPEGYTLPNTHGCSNNDFAELYPGLFANDREMLNRTLLAAFLAGRPVQLRLDGCGVQNRPAYRMVRLDANQ